MPISVAMHEQYLKEQGSFDYLLKEIDEALLKHGYYIRSFTQEEIGDFDKMKNIISIYKPLGWNCIKKRE